ncbi:protein transport protein SEC31-like isoform X1 [Sipha flava]|jgi:hypothetical protein|uniref:Protein transport protein SEC31-like isoform X1 n=1 Tax=Sipha flava TaxID=143950 RepID=A0A2S2QDB2_9HEMI|nr:protein transport protein SEC31-like isoform X1 [Sipha flava]
MPFGQNGSPKSPQSEPSEQPPSPPLDPVNGSSELPPSKPSGQPPSLPIDPQNGSPEISQVDQKYNEIRNLLRVPLLTAPTGPPDVSVLHQPMKQPLVYSLPTYAEYRRSPLSTLYLGFWSKKSMVLFDLAKQSPSTQSSSPL